VPNAGVVGGFGHLGAFPGEIVVEQVFDVVVSPNATYDYGFPARPNL
jgi:hypothetical protein